MIVLSFVFILGTLINNNGKCDCEGGGGSMYYSIQLHSSLNSERYSS